MGIGLWIKSVPLPSPNNRVGLILVLVDVALSHPGNLPCLALFSAQLCSEITTTLSYPLSFLAQIPTDQLHLPRKLLIIIISIRVVRTPMHPSSLYPISKHYHNRAHLSTTSPTQRKMISSPNEQQQPSEPAAQNFSVPSIIHPSSPLSPLCAHHVVKSNTSVPVSYLYSKHIRRRAYSLTHSLTLSVFLGALAEGRKPTGHL